MPTDAELARQYAWQKTTILAWTRRHGFKMLPIYSLIYTYLAWKGAF